MRLLKNPTRKIFRKQKKRKNHTPQSHFRCSLFKKGRNSSASRKGGVGELMDFRQPNSSGGEKRRRVMVSWLRREKGRQRRREEEGQLKH